MEFFELITVEEANKMLSEQIKHVRPHPEKLDLMDSLGRVVYEDINSPINLPGFRKSTVDGFAVKAQDTFGASEAMPAMFVVVDEVFMGKKTETEIFPGQAVKIPTGGMLPAGADAVVMVEHTEMLDETTLNVYKSLSPFENVVREDEDLKKGDLVLPKGQVLRPQDLGVLAAMGITGVTVAKKPLVAIISTGDEVVSPDASPQPGQIRDINTYSLMGLAKGLGADVMSMGIVKDSYDLLAETIKKAMETADIVVISGGSSVGTRDVTYKVINDAGPPGILVHGVSVKPGKPTIIGAVRGKPIFGLPGHPVSAMTTFNLVVKPVIYKLLGRVDKFGRFSRVKAFLKRNIASSGGKLEVVRVALVEENGKLWADPVMGKSALISTMVKADGVINISREKRGLEKGSIVEVELF